MITIDKIKIVILILFFLTVIGLVVLVFNFPNITYSMAIKRVATQETIKEVVLTNSDMEFAQIRLTNEEDYEAIVHHISDNRSKFESAKISLSPSGGWSKRVRFSFKDGSFLDAFVSKDYIKIGRCLYFLPNNELNSILDNMQWD